MPTGDFLFLKADRVVNVKNYSGGQGIRVADGETIEIDCPVYSAKVTNISGGQANIPFFNGVVVIDLTKFSLPSAKKSRRNKAEPEPEPEQKPKPKEEPTKKKKSKK